MTWVRIDETFATHPKVVAAGNAAVGLWLRCLTWSASQLTDGVIPDAIARMYGPAKDMNRLAEVGLWRKDGNAWVIPDYLEYQPSAEQVREQRRDRHEAKVRAGRIGGLQKAANRLAGTQQTPSTPVAEGLANRSPDPTRPDPTPVTDSLPPLQVSRIGPTMVGWVSQPYEDALDLAVEHEYALERTPPGKPAAWKKSVRARIARQHGAAILGWLECGRTPEEAFHQVYGITPPAPRVYFTATDADTLTDEHRTEGRKQIEQLRKPKETA